MMHYNYWHTFFAILRRDTLVFQKHIGKRFIDACIWTAIVLYVPQYILPQLGISKVFGTFIMLGNIAAWGMLEVGTNISITISDLEGTNRTGYFLSLPLPQWMIFLRIGLIDAYKSFISTLPMIPVGKLVLWNHVSLWDISYGKLFLSYTLAHLFFGFLGLALASITSSLHDMTTIKLRILFPMWFIGCYQFTWHMLYKASPTVAYSNLLNPIVYIMESLRSTMITDFPLIPYWYCILFVSFATTLCAYIGISIFKKRLNCL